MMRAVYEKRKSCPDKLQNADLKAASAAKGYDSEADRTLSRNDLDKKD